MATWTLARKDLRLLARDTRALVILLAMPLIFIFVLGLSLGESFGQKPDDSLRISVVDEDAGLPPNPGPFPGRPWSDVVRDDLAGTAGIRVEVIPGRDEAVRLTARGERAAVLVFTPKFSDLVHHCSFLDDKFLADPPGINPFFRDGIDLKSLGVEVIEDPNQPLAGSVIRQVAQVSLLRVVMPWMIGKAFDKISDKQFVDELATRVKVTPPFGREPTLKPLSLLTSSQRGEVGVGVQESLKEMFHKYNLMAKTWASLTKSEAGTVEGGGVVTYHDQGGTGLVHRGAARYQVLVPSYTVMFAFFMVLTVGWLFVAERRQGTMLRLRAAPISRSQVMLGKFIPCFLLTLFQGFFLLAGGKLVFGMSWGAEPLWLVPVVVTTALAATGLAMLVASLARTETQVSTYGTLLVLVLAGVSGCLMPRDLMPEQMKEISRVTPHAWALDAYSQLLVSPSPSPEVVFTSCLVLTGFGVGFLLLAWLALRLD